MSVVAAYLITTQKDLCAFWSFCGYLTRLLLVAASPRWALRVPRVVQSMRKPNCGMVAVTWDGRLIFYLKNRARPSSGAWPGPGSLSCPRSASWCSCSTIDCHGIVSRRFTNAVKFQRHFGQHRNDSFDHDPSGFVCRFPRRCSAEWTVPPQPSITCVRMQFAQRF